MKYLIVSESEIDQGTFKELINLLSIENGHTVLMVEPIDDLMAEFLISKEFAEQFKKR